MSELTTDPRGPARRDTPRIAGGQLPAPEHPQGEITLSDHGDRAVLTVTGGGAGRSASELVRMLQGLDPKEHPLLTLDLRDATELSPLVIHALLRVWERRHRQFDSIRILTGPGAVARYLDAVGLASVFEVVRSDAQGGPGHPALSPEAWEEAQSGTVEHCQRLLAAARRRDLPALKHAARHAHPLCIASGAELGGPAFGEWCARCPLTEQYGGCRPLMDQMLRAAAQENWDAAQLLILAMIAEAVGMKHVDGSE